MTKRYTGGVVSSSLPTVNAAGASGVFLLSQQSDYQSRNAWPPYKVEESLRFRSGASAYLNKTFSIAGNRKTWTWSGWVKRGSLGGDNSIFTGYGNGTQTAGIYFSNDTVTDALEVRFGPYSGSWQGFLVTTQVFRDPSAWYHIVFAADTTQATSTDRLKLYVNGVQVTAFQSSSYPSQNSDGFINQAQAHEIGRLVTNNGYLFDGYMSEINFIDGQALTPSSFGATDKDGNWSPIAYTGTYGTNGFYLNFRDNTSATTMGYDYSGNGNNWTLNGFNVSTANTTYDIMIDVPEDQAGANNRGSYATLNPIKRGTTYNPTLSNGNLTYTAENGSQNPASSTMGVSTGSWYCEATITNFGYSPAVGVHDPSDNFGTGDNWRTAGMKGVVLFAGFGGEKYENGTYTTSTGYTFTTGDIMGIAFDASSGKVWIAKNNTWFNSGNPSAGTGQVGTASGYSSLAPIVDGTNNAGNKDTINVNFGQRPFTYTPPTGFKTLNTFNLPEPTIKQPNKQFDVNNWTGDNTTPRSITNSGSMQPDFVWIKRRNGSAEHVLFDAVRGFGGNKELSSNNNGVEGALNTSLYGYVSAANSNGFQLTAGSTDSSYTNRTSDTYVGWQWNAGGSTVTNTSGSISAQVRANPTAGFSIVTYTGTGSNATVGHGLSVAPQMIFVKNRAAAGYSWLVYHKFMAASSPATWYMSLNGTAAASNGANVWIDDPTSTVFTISGSYPEVNGSTNTYVAYCFAPIAGYSAFGSYTGNGSTDGPFIYTGFRPKWILMKSTTETGLQWSLWDSSRIGYNPSNYFLAPQSSAAEDTTNSGSNSNGGPDFLSNGFKMRSNGGSHNSSGATYIYAAFAEVPFKYARSR